MKPLRLRLEEARARTGTPWEVLERDYLLSWLLAGITQIPELRQGLIFKGGTALKKCYFGDYRFSEDLDFTSTDFLPTAGDLDSAITASCQTATRLLHEHAPVEITSERYAEKDPHPAGQDAFVVRARFPWHKALHTRVMIEVTRDEPLVRPALARSVLHEYGEPFEAIIVTYSLEEIVAEKLRAILQHQIALETRGWSRSRARDYYDIWRVLAAYGHALDFTDFRTLLATKCAVRGISLDERSDFFAEPMRSHVKATWDQWLGPLVPNLPPFDAIASELTPQIAALLHPTH